MFRNGFDFKVNDSILDQNGHWKQTMEIVFALTQLNTSDLILVFEKRPLTFIDKNVDIPIGASYKSIQPRTQIYKTYRYTHSYT
jgi:hypothetical protein